MRTPLLVANWKMHKTSQDGVEFVKRLRDILPSMAKEVVLCPPYTALEAVTRALQGTGWKLGAQNCHYEEKGAFTGEISPVMLTNLGCSYVILGHSERRQYFGENGEIINKKVHAALRWGLLPILCVGETLEQREKGETFSHVRKQMEECLAGIAPDQARAIVIAYEPVWAIGTGRSASKDDAQKVAGFLRKSCEEMFGAQVSENMRILYGGSVKPENIAEFSTEPDIDGALVGGASLDPQSFAGIVAGF